MGGGAAAAVRAVVTGGAGFIGSHVVERLLAMDWHVGVVDDLSRGLVANVPAGARFLAASVASAEAAAFLRAFRPHVVLHLAAQVNAVASWQQPDADAVTNVLGTIAVARACLQSGVRRLVLASSAAVYGPPLELPVPEEHPPQPALPYGVSKLACEHYVRVLMEAAGREWCVLRYANVFGPRQRADGEAGVVAVFWEAVRWGRPLVVHGDGEQTRDFVYVGDVAAATALAATHPAAAGGVFNIGTGHETSVLELARRVWGLAGREGPVPLAFEPPRPGDVRRSALQVDRAERLLGWRPAVRLDEGLALMAGGPGGRR